jgi:hypothetical protein
MKDQEVKLAQTLKNTINMGSYNHLDLNNTDGELKRRISLRQRKFIEDGINHA